MLRFFWLLFAILFGYFGLVFGITTSTKFRATVYDMEVVAVAGIFSLEKQLESMLNRHNIAQFSENQDDLTPPGR